MAYPRIVSRKGRGVKLVRAAAAKALKHAALMEALAAAQRGAILVGRGALLPGSVFPYMHVHDRVMANSGADIVLERVAEGQRLRARWFAKPEPPHCWGERGS